MHIGTIAETARRSKQGHPGVVLLFGVILVFLSASWAKANDDTIKVGILHSLSGSFASTETPLKDALLMLIDLQNQRGGVLGKKLEAVVVDPASNWPLFSEKARELITKDRVAVVFGCWTAVSLVAVQPVFKELNSVLFYPSHEGFSPVSNVFFTGGAPSQFAIPAVDYLMKKEGVKRWIVEGSESGYTQALNQILKDYFRANGIPDQDVSIHPTQFGTSDWRDRVTEIKNLASQGKKTAVLSAVANGAGAALALELVSQSVRSQDVPVLSLSMNEQQLSQEDYKPFAGHLTVSNYFPFASNPANDEFIRKWRDFTKDTKRVPSEAMEAHFIGFSMWVKAVEKVHSSDADKVIDALPGIEVPNLSGGTSRMLPNHHVTKPVFIGQIDSDGRISLVSKVSNSASSGSNCPTCPKSGACPQAIVATCTACPKSGACPQ
jgi:urea transport system substrate-binding protein